MNAPAGTPSSFEELSTREYPRLYRRALSLLGNLQEAENLTQEVCVKAWCNNPPGMTEHLTDWLMTITRRTAIDALRAKRVRPPHQSLEQLAGWLDEVATPVDEAETSSKRLAFCAAWQQLPAREQARPLSQGDRDPARTTRA